MSKKFPSPPIRTPFIAPIGNPFPGLGPISARPAPGTANIGGNASISFNGGQANQSPSWPWQQWYQNIVNWINAPVIPNSPPANSAAKGTQWQIVVDANYIYICVAPNQWKRSALGVF
jgi:hypothetical protein